MKNILIIWKILNINLKKYKIVGYKNQINNTKIIFTQTSKHLSASS
jgi:hypothetical protein